MSTVLHGHLVSHTMQVTAVCLGGIATVVKLDNVRSAANKKSFS